MNGKERDTVLKRGAKGGKETLEIEHDKRRDGKGESTAGDKLEVNRFYLRRYRKNYDEVTFVSE